MRILTAAAIVLCAATVATAQSPDPAFDAASIKVNASGEAGGRFSTRPGELSVVNYTLRDIIRNAYGVQRYQIVGGPEWLEKDRFDITAKTGVNPTQAQMRDMVQALLAERFKLRVHTATQNLPVYALRLARADGRLGPKLTPAAVDCDALEAARSRGETPVIPPRVGERPACGAQANPGRLLVGDYRIGAFARNLGGYVGRPVLDRTGLTERYDFELLWTPDEPPPAGVSVPPWYDPNGPSLPAALTEQLGLKLDATTGPVEVLVIDSAERPTEN